MDWEIRRAPFSREEHSLTLGGVSVKAVRCMDTNLWDAKVMVDGEDIGIGEIIGGNVDECRAIALQAAARFAARLLRRVDALVGRSRGW